MVPAMNTIGGTTTAVNDGIRHRARSELGALIATTGSESRPGS
jgi:hypothetical protein